MSSKVLAGQACTSERQLQRDFRDVVGISPRDYGQLIRSNNTRQLLRDRETVSQAIFDAGYGSVRAFYESAAQRFGMSPTEYAQGAPDHTLLWSTTQSRIGLITAVASPRGLCAVRIGDQDSVLAEIQAEFASAVLERDDNAMRDVMRALHLLAQGTAAPDLPLDLVGTAFQARVWKHLREIPAGETHTYSEVASAIGEPTAVRAVASACARNPVALTVPCHRVIRSDGTLAGYRWGLEVKEKLLVQERS